MHLADRIHVAGLTSSMAKAFAAFLAILSLSIGPVQAFLPEDDFSSPDSVVYVVTDVRPSFGRGPADLSKFLLENLNYPDEAYEKKVTGNVYVRFVIEADGSISHVSVNRSSSPLLNDEAIRLIKSMPRWNPGKIAGKPVRTLYGFPLQFMLKGENNDAVMLDDGRPKLRAGAPPRLPEPKTSTVSKSSSKPTLKRKTVRKPLPSPKSCLGYR